MTGREDRREGGRIWRDDREGRRIERDDREGG